MMTAAKGTHPAELERRWANGERNRQPSFGIGIQGSPGPVLMGGYMMGPPQLDFIEQTVSMTPGGNMIVHDSSYVPSGDRIEMCYHCGQNTPHCREWDGTYKCRVVHKSAKHIHASTSSGGSSSGKTNCPCGNSCVNTEASHMSECTHPRGDWERLHYCHNHRCGCNTPHKFSGGKWVCSNSH